MTKRWEFCFLNESDFHLTGQMEGFKSHVQKEFIGTIWKEEAPQRGG